MSMRIGLALSGGGYRAAAFHLGTLKALKRLGLLYKLDVISAVSGGSILAAYYGLHINEDFDTFERSFRKRLKRCSLTGFIINLVLVFLTPLILSIIFTAWFLLLYLLLFFFGFNLIPSSYWIEIAYDGIFFKKKILKDLPDSPVIGINSTNISTGRLFTFSKQHVGGYDYRTTQDKSTINGDDISVSFAVSCSTCVPMFFSPRKIKKKYFFQGKYKPTLLVDGGLYDNQGAYILCESSNPIYRVNNIIVSDAGNSIPSGKFVRNTFCLMYQSIEVLMRRIKTMQIRKNIYHQRNTGSQADTQFAYLSLSWDNLQEMPQRFIKNAIKGFVDKRVLQEYSISEEDLNVLREENGIENHTALFNELVEDFKKIIDWETLRKTVPSNASHKIAYRVRTNLTPLTNKKLDALSDYADWLTELQIKTYLPHLLKQ